MIVPVRFQDMKAAELERPQVVILGRSNAGKSSLLNMVFKQKLARVSQNPGCTGNLWFYRWKNGYWVDCPGYGFAKRAQSLRGKWKQQMETYLSSSPGLRGAVLLLDARRSWTEDETDLALALQFWQIRLCIGLTKIDKVSRSYAIQKRKELAALALSQSVFTLSIKQPQTVRALVAWVNEYGFKKQLNPVVETS